ncbi:NUDIX domain-containing protein [Streptomyces sp. BI20]|uniref:NUDIX domain-containing protein n=1 Tax=Streptomyces sp. BI20 TaxID=3403460 RepID=UPI003C7583C6
MPDPSAPPPEPAARPTPRHRTSAGLLLYRPAPGPAGFEVLLGHMGGPLWASRDAGAWTVPKGEHGPEEEPLAAARREFEEELGLAPPAGSPRSLGSVRQSGGKVVTVWALAGEVDVALFRPGTFTMQWPPRSGRTAEFPELDRVAWCTPAEAETLLVRAQAAFPARLAELLAGDAD